MKTVLVTLFLSALGFPLIGNASQVQMSATAYSSDQCQYYSTSLADFNISLTNNTPWGSRVIFRYGFHDNFSNNSWAASSQVEMTATAPNTWSASVKGVQVDARGSSYFDAIQFDFEVIAADGSSTYDNGGSSDGFYQATLPNRSCQPGNLQPLALNVVRK